MSDEQYAIVILLMVNAAMAFYIMYQDWQLDQYKGYIERMDRERWTDEYGQDQPNTGDRL